MPSRDAEDHPERFASDAARELVEKRLAGAPSRPSYVEIPTDELPRRLPQDPEAVLNEREVRRIAAELTATPSLPLAPDPELADIDPSNEYRDARIAALEERVAFLESLAKRLRRSRV